MKTVNQNVASHTSRKGEAEMKTKNRKLKRESNAECTEPPLSKGGWGVEVAIANQRAS